MLKLRTGARQTRGGGAGRIQEADLLNTVHDHSTGPAAEPSGRFLSSAPRGGGGWGPPLCIGKQEVGAYIYSLLYTYTGLLGRLPMKFYSR
jgi:hypothetical protein